MLSKGQSLLELIIVMAVAVIVIGALTVVTISSLRNANLSKNQLQATKYAQEGIEKIRSIRDRDGIVTTNFGTLTDKFSQLWGIQLYQVCTPQPCNFLLGSISNTLTQNNTAFESLAGGFERRIKITDENSSYQNQKTVTVLVSWIDFSGSHESHLTTILRRI